MVGVDGSPKLTALRAGEIGTPEGVHGHASSAIAPSEVTALEPAAVALRAHHHGAGHEAVDHGGGVDGGIWKSDHAGPLVAGGHQLQVGGLALEGDVADLADDEEGIEPQAAELGVQAAGGMRLGQSVDPLGGGGEATRWPTLQARMDRRWAGGPCPCRLVPGTPSSPGPQGIPRPRGGRPRSRAVMRWSSERNSSSVLRAEKRAHGCGPPRRWTGERRGVST